MQVKDRAAIPAGLGRPDDQSPESLNLVGVRGVSLPARGSLVGEGWGGGIAGHAQIKGLFFKWIQRRDRDCPEIGGMGPGAIRRPLSF